MSQFKVSGVVSNTTTKTKQTRVGDKIINYATVDGHEFSTGFKKVFADGEMVNCVVEFKFGEHQLVEGLAFNASLPALGSQPPQAPKQAWGGNKGGGSNRTFPVDKTDGQMSIIRQNSMNRAVEILDGWMCTLPPLFIPANQEEYLQKLMEVALTITDFNSGQDIMQMQAAAAQIAAVNG